MFSEGGTQSGSIGVKEDETHAQGPEWTAGTWSEVGGGAK